MVSIPREVARYTASYCLSYRVECVVSVDGYFGGYNACARRYERDAIVATAIAAEFSVERLLLCTSQSDYGSARDIDSRYCGARLYNLLCKQANSCCVALCSIFFMAAFCYLS